MKATWTIPGLMALWLAVTLTGPAEEPRSKPADPATPAAANKAVPSVEVRVKLHRALADLIEARGAAKPDAAKVARLTKQVQELRKQIAGTTGEKAATLPCGRPACPLTAEPGAGRGRGAGFGPGAGAGRGAGFGSGAGRGPGGRWANPDAAPEPGAGFGPGAGRGRGVGAGAGQGFGPGCCAAAMSDPSSDQAVFHYLLDNHKAITRKVTKRPDGVETLTESDRPEVVAKIQEHAAAMHRRVKEGRPIHMRDPLFREIFAYVDRIEMTVEKTPRGVRVRETSKDAYVARLIQAHAEVVNRFVKNGRSEAWKNHPVPAVK